jgi:hypothetical protein
MQRFSSLAIGEAGRKWKKPSVIKVSPPREKLEIWKMSPRFLLSSAMIGIEYTPEIVVDF